MYCHIKHVSLLLNDKHACRHSHRMSCLISSTFKLSRFIRILIAHEIIAFEVHGFLDESDISCTSTRYACIHRVHVGTIVALQLAGSAIAYSCIIASPRREGTGGVGRGERREEGCSTKRRGRLKEEVEEEEEVSRVRWRRLECPRTTNGADTTGLPFTAYLPVVSLRLHLRRPRVMYLPPSLALFSVEAPQQRFHCLKNETLPLQQRTQSDSVHVYISINLIINRRLLSIYKRFN